MTSQASCATILNVAGWILGTIVTSWYCLIVILPALLFLWVIGLLTIVDWADWRLTRGYEVHKDLDGRTIQSGDERGELWHRARIIAKATHFIEDYEDSGHYHVAPLLRLATSLRLHDLWLNIKQQEALELPVEQHGPQMNVSTNLSRKMEEVGWCRKYVPERSVKNTPFRAQFQLNPSII